VPRYTEAELREVVAGARSLSEDLRHFGQRPAGGNHRHHRRWLETWGIPTDHFSFEWDPPPRTRMPLSEILVEGSAYHRGPYEQLVAEVAATSWSAVGRKYGVSEHAIRKWVRAYEREAGVAAEEATRGSRVESVRSVRGDQLASTSVCPRSELAAAVVRHRRSAADGLVRDQTKPMKRRTAPDAPRHTSFGHGASVGAKTA
jgi:transposase-like protein